MKNVLFFAVAGTMAASTPAFASTPTPFHLPGEISTNIALATDYAFRGLSQTDRNPALQGGVNYNAPIRDDLNFYAGLWGSNVNFNDGDETDLETDYFAGATYKNGDYSFDLSGIYYAYPGASEAGKYDYYEMQASASRQFSIASVVATFNYSPDYFGGTGHAEYYRLGASAPLAFLPKKGFTLDGHVGRQNVEKSTDYVDWAVGVSYAWNDYTLKTEYVDTDLSESECGMTGLCGNRVILSASHSF
ncbi:MAG: TorF family putative porin [Rickettsiales bacterium]